MMEAKFGGLSPALASRIRTHEPMAEHTSFQVGGPADYFFSPSSVEEVKEILRWAREQQLPLTFVGNGSNLVVADQGIRGLVICLEEAFSEMTFVEAGQVDACLEPADHSLWRRFCEGLPHSPNYTDFGVPPVLLRAQAGALIKAVSATARLAGMTGLEFACGIPGSVGGVVNMNAGAYGNSIEDSVFLTRSLSLDGLEHWTLGEGHQFDYRSSYFSRAGHVVLESYFCLRPGDAREVENLCADYSQRRQTTQPLDLPSAGSMFKRPRGYFAGKLISDAGLKGFQVGGAAVSEKHAGFIVNLGGAKAEDIRNLVRQIQQRVFDMEGVRLETEVKFIGDWDEVGFP